MLESLKQEVFEANMALPRHKLVTFTWGNVSGIDRERQLVVIKPSGVAYDQLRPEDMVVVDLAGNVVEGRYRPSSDTATHLVLYHYCADLGGIVHTHSTHATAWAQACLPIPALGTTHADYFLGEIPCTRALRREEVEGDYEQETGRVIVETFKNRDLRHTPGVIVSQHGPFSWGVTPGEAVHNAVVLEEVAKMAWIACSVNPHLHPINEYLMRKHFNRKHGAGAYYGQHADGQRKPGT